MARAKREVTTRGADASLTSAVWPLPEGEIHYLWWFIQGSIMEPEMRGRLRRAWGFCGRHAWGALAVEAAYRSGYYFHGPAVLYQDLMERGARALGRTAAAPARRLARRLRATGPCPVCEMGFARLGRGAAPEARIAQGRDARPLQTFAEKTQAHWWRTVCGVCLGAATAPRCRPHLVEALTRGGSVDLRAQGELAESLRAHVTAYARSFRWECRDTETDEDRAALVSAVGWCSGWQAWLPLLTGRSSPEEGAPHLAPHEARPAPGVDALPVA
jgi:hypothetical protein